MKYILRNKNLPEKSAQKPLQCFVAYTDGSNPELCNRSIEVGDIPTDGSDIDLTHITRPIFRSELEKVINVARGSSALSGTGIQFSEETAKDIEKHKGDKFKDVPHMGEFSDGRIVIDYSKETIKNKIKYSANENEVGGLYIAQWSWFAPRYEEGDMEVNGIQYYAYSDGDYTDYCTEVYTGNTEKQLTFYYLDGEEMFEDATLFAKYYTTGTWAGSITINQGYINEDKIIVVNWGNYEMVRNSANDTVIDGVQYYAYTNNNYTLCLKEEYTGTEEKEVTFYYTNGEEYGTATIKFEAKDPSYSGATQQMLYLIPGIDSEVEYEGECVSISCNSNRYLTNIIIPDSVTSIGENAFNSCSNLTGITIPSSVTSIGNGAFSGCTSLTSIIIPDSVTSIGNFVFEGCTALNSITIPDSVTLISGHMFSYCTSLTNVTIPNSVTSIGYCAFYDCSALTGITIGTGLTSIGTCAFEGCTSLTSITWLGTTTPTSEVNAFNNIASAGTLYYNEGVDYTGFLAALPSGWTASEIVDPVIWLSAGTDEYLISAMQSLYNLGYIANTTYITHDEAIAYNLGYAYYASRATSAAPTKIKTHIDATKFSDANIHGKYAYSADSYSWKTFAACHSGVAPMSTAAGYLLMMIHEM